MRHKFRPFINGLRLLVTGLTKHIDRLLINQIAYTEVLTLPGYPYRRLYLILSIGYKLANTITNSAIHITMNIAINITTNVTIDIITYTTIDVTISPQEQYYIL